MELTERSPIIIQNGSSNPSSRKNLDLRPYDRPYKMLLLTCVVNCTAATPKPLFLQQSSGQCTELRGGRPGFQSWPGQGVVPLGRAGKKMRAPLLGLVKSIYYMLYMLYMFPLIQKFKRSLERSYTLHQSFIKNNL